jgi:hypothetical protein
VPSYNVTTICSRIVDPILQTQGGCTSSEQSARQQLQKEWRQYSSADRAECRSNMTELPSYSELLTCLEMMKQARSVPAQ